jgi:hypothetical protein
MALADRVYTGLRPDVAATAGSLPRHYPVCANPNEPGFVAGRGGRNRTAAGTRDRAAAGLIGPLERAGVMPPLVPGGFTGYTHRPG